MNKRSNSDRRRSAELKRRSFLQGIAGVCVGLPFLESLPERSAWAQGSEPRFGLFIGTPNGVIADDWWPSEVGPLTALADDPHAAGALAEVAQHVLFVQGITYPASNTGCSHAQGYVQMYTGAPSDGSSNNNATSTAPSIDTILAAQLNADGAEPLALYSGLKSGYINERISFVEAGQVRAAQGNPYEVYQDLLRLSSPLPADQDPSEAAAMIDELTLRRQSAVDLVRDELLTLQGRSGLSQADRSRLELHLGSLRDVEQSMGNIAAMSGSIGCSDEGLDIAGINEVAETYRTNGMIERVARLQMELAAFAFACNLNHVASLQIGDGTDATVYDVPSNSRRWTFHHISHQAQSDGSVGTDLEAVQAHREIDRIRMETLNHGLLKFDAHGLLDKSIVMWTNMFTSGTSNSFYDLPMIVAGNPGGALASGQYLQLEERSVQNGRLLTTVAQLLGVPVNIGVSEGIVDEILA